MSSPRVAALAALLSCAAPGIPGARSETDGAKFPGQPAVQLALPPGWHAGGEVDLEIEGSGLFGPKDLLFYRDGIEVLSVEEIGDRPMTNSERYQHRRKLQDRARRKGETLEGDIDYPRKEVKPGTRVRARVRISAKAPPGEYPFRLLARGGLGSLMTFWVGRLPTIEEAEWRDRSGDNDSPENAEPIELGRTVNGFIARHDADVFRLSAEAGQRISLEVEATRLGTLLRNEFLDVQVTVTDADGGVIAAVDDTALFLEDPHLGFLAPKTGDYFVRIEESVPTGSGRLMPYRLHVSEAIRPAMIYPAGGAPGREIEIAAVLPGEARHERKLKLPAADGPRTARVALDDESPFTSAIRLFDAPNVLETEPNNEARRATASGEDAPVALNGILSEPGDVDVFRVRLRKDARYTVRLFSSALGSPLDARMWIAPAENPRARKRFDDSGEEELDRVAVATIRDRLDPAGLFTPEADGDYLVGVEDGRGGGGELGVYRVEIAEAADSVISYVVPPRNNEPRNGNRVQVFPGSRFSAVIALRNGFGSEAEGPFELVARGLPEGVRMTAPVFDGASDRLPVVFEAAGNAGSSASLVELHVRPAGGGTVLPGGFRGSVPFNDVGGNNYLHYHFTERLPVAVVEGAPYSLEVEAPKAALTQDGELALDVRVRRAPGYEDPIEINAQWLPPNSARPSPVTLQPGESEAEFLIGARRNTPPEEYRIALTAASTRGDRRTGDGRYSASSALLPVRVAQPYLTARLPRVAVEIGKTAEVVASLEHLTPFEGAARVRLGRLPAGVEMVGGPVAVKPGQEKVSFTIRATETALTGSYRGIFCDLEFNENGQKISQRSGYGTLRVDARRGKPVAGR